MESLHKSLGDRDKLTTEEILALASEYANGIDDLTKNKLSYLAQWKDEREYDRIYWGLTSSLERIETILVTKLISFIEKRDIIDFFSVQYGNAVKQDSTEVSTPIPVTEKKADKHNAYCFVLNELPVPSDSTPWEAILDYRSDSDNKLRLSRMRTWIRKTLKEEYSEKEL